MSGKNQNNDYVIKELSDQIKKLRNELPNGEVDELREDIRENRKLAEKISDNVDEIRKTIMDPENGIIVRVNKNTEYRKALEAQEQDNTEILKEHQALVKFKKNVTKLLWIITGALVSIMAKMFFFGK